MSVAAQPMVTAEGEPLLSPRLQFTSVAPPVAPQVHEVAPQAWWLRVPMPMELDHINVWLLESHDGYLLIDTGLAASPCRAAWELVEREIFKKLHSRRSLSRMPTPITSDSLLGCNNATMFRYGCPQEHSSWRSCYFSSDPPPR